MPDREEPAVELLAVEGVHVEGEAIHDLAVIVGHDLRQRDWRRHGEILLDSGLIRDETDGALVEPLGVFARGPGILHRAAWGVIPRFGQDAVDVRAVVQQCHAGFADAPWRDVPVEPRRVLAVGPHKQARLIAQMIHRQLAAAEERRHHVALGVRGDDRVVPAAADLAAQAVRLVPVHVRHVSEEVDIDRPAVDVALLDVDHHVEDAGVVPEGPREGELQTGAQRGGEEHGLQDALPVDGSAGACEHQDALRDDVIDIDPRRLRRGEAQSVAGGPLALLNAEMDRRAVHKVGVADEGHVPRRVQDAKEAGDAVGHDALFRVDLDGHRRDGQRHRAVALHHPVVALAQRAAGDPATGDALPLSVGELADAVVIVLRRRVGVRERVVEGMARDEVGVAGGGVDRRRPVTVPNVLPAA